MIPGLKENLHKTAQALPINLRDPQVPLPQGLQRQIALTIRSVMTAIKEE
jgi:hypothetical protein